MIGNGPKWTIFTNNELGLLQMISEPDIGCCVNEITECPKGVNCEIPRWLESETKHFL